MHSLLRIPLLLASLCVAAFATGQVLPNYALFDAKGKPLSHRKMMSMVTAGEVVLFGELHNNSIAHWMQLEVARDLAGQGPLVLGGEMFERDDQEALDRYLRGEVDGKGLDTLARLWPNYKTDYSPLVELAREFRSQFVATNVPRRYARAVSRGGFEALDTVPDDERRWIAPLPIAFDPALPRYVAMLEMMQGHGTPDMVKAQALKDATMAHSIRTHRKEGMRFLHFNGSYHSDYHEGVAWYLHQAEPALRVVTITTVTQRELRKLEAEHQGKADIILVVDEDVPGSY